jgi:hypothetical protein
MKLNPLLILILTGVLTTLTYAQTSAPTDINPQIESSSVKKPPSTKVFQSDGCTMWFNGQYRKCCDNHDLDYFKGSGWRDRLTADNRLFTCVAKMGFEYSIVAPVMWLGVRIFGSPWFPIHKKKKVK